MGKLKYEEICIQPYNDCSISSGFLYGHEHDTMYLRFSRYGEEPTNIHLRADEMAAIVHVCSGTLWSKLIDEVKE